MIDAMGKYCGLLNRGETGPGKGGRIRQPCTKSVGQEETESWVTSLSSWNSSAVDSEIWVESSRKWGKIQKGNCKGIKWVLKEGWLTAEEGGGLEGGTRCLWRLGKWRKMEIWKRWSILGRCCLAFEVKMGDLSDETLNSLENMG